MGVKNFQELKKAAENGGPDDWFELGMYYVDQRDVDNIIYWMKKGADIGHVKSIHKLWPMYKMTGNELECLKVLNTLVNEHKDPLAMLEMGLMFMESGTEADGVKPIDLIDTAIKVYVQRDGDIVKMSWQHKCQVGTLFAGIKDAGGEHDPIKLWMATRLLDDVVKNQFDDMKKYTGEEYANATKEFRDKSINFLGKKISLLQSSGDYDTFKKTLEAVYAIRI